MSDPQFPAIDAAIAEGLAKAYALGRDEERERCLRIAAAEMVPSTSEADAASYAARRIHTAIRGGGE